LAARIVCRAMHFLTARQVEGLAAAIDPHYELLVRFAAYTGLRDGELVALPVRHLNLLRGRCEVGESATESDGRLVWGPTKTCAHRTVPPPRFLCEQLAACLAERPHGPNDLVFTARRDGDPGPLWAPVPRRTPAACRAPPGSYADAITDPARTRVPRR
jgi:integrase